MEKIIIQSVLFSTAILVVYALVSPPVHLSAESAPTLDPSERVRKGIVKEVLSDKDRLVVDFEGVSVAVAINASTTVYAPNGEETELSFFRDGSAVYVFGYYDSKDRIIEAEKIVMRNRSPLERKSLSRAEMKSAREEKRRSAPPALDDLSLTAQ